MVVSLAFYQKQKMIVSFCVRYAGQHQFQIMIKGLSTHLFVAEKLTIGRLESVISSGFERVEIFALKPHFDYQNKALVSALGSWFAEHGSFLHSIHTPFCMEYQARGEREWLSIANLEKLQRERAVDEIRRALELAEKISFPFAIVHMGAPDDPYTFKHLDAVYYSLETLIPFARDRGVTLALENIPNQLSHLERMLTFFEETRLTGIGICFDSGHSNLLANPAEEIKTAKGWIVTTHLHDNKGRKDEHLLPFEGSIEWPKVLESFEKIHYQGCLLLELKSEDRDPGQVLKSAIQTFDRFKECQEALAEA